MYYRYLTGWRSPEPVGPEFLLAGQRFGYVFPSDGGVACVALSVPVTDHDAMRTGPARHLAEFFRANAATRERMDAATWQGGVYVGRPEDSLWKQAAGPGWALVGDAGTRQDPWAGVGMDSAAEQAEAFAEAFLGAPGAWVAPYAELRRERTYAGFAETTDLAPDLRRLLD
jgi:flavin-dependent dehydrogenase